MPDIYAQQSFANDRDEKAVTKLIDDYSESREKSDTILLKKILTTDVDQLVSTGEWRKGIRAAVDGMLKSSATRPGSRTLKIESFKMIETNTAIADCRYEIMNEDSTSRKMWSTFIIVREKAIWKIAAIRNMLPAN